MKYGTVEDRLLSFRKIDPITGCWRTTGFIAPNGYGRITVNKITHNIHRLSASIYLGLNLTDSRQQANHRRECPHKDCFNPDHLYTGTQASNILDEVVLRRHKEVRKTHCPQGHEYTEENTKYYRGKRYCRECHKTHYPNKYRLHKKQEVSQTQ